MATKVYTRAELESIFEKMYLNKLVRFTYPGKPEIVGILSRLAIDHQGLVILGINYERYEVSVESFQECISIINKS